VGVDRRVHDERQAATDISNVSSYTATGLAVDPVLFRDNAEESVGYGSGTFSGDAVGSTATTTYDPSVAAIDAGRWIFRRCWWGGRELTELWMSCITRQGFSRRRIVRLRV
jgi:hypothetical protein